MDFPGLFTGLGHLFVELAVFRTFNIINTRGDFGVQPRGLQGFLPDVAKTQLDFALDSPPPESNRVFCEFSGGIGEALIGALSALLLTIFWSEASLLSSWTSFNFVSPTAHFSFPFSAQLLNRLSDPRFPPFQC